LIFDRNESEINFGTGLKKVFAGLAVNPDMPLLSFLAITTGVEAIKDAADWFRGCISVNYNIEESENFFYLNNDDSMKKLVISMLNEMDIGVTDYYFRETDKKLTPYQIILKRQFNGKEYEMPLSSESEGTKKLFSFLPQVVSAINDGRIIIVDELDTKLHPKLLKHIIMLFKNPQINKKNAQLIFTSHDLATMRNDVFRRDEIWFAEKNTQGISMLYSLYDIRNDGNKHIKSTAEFAKQYLEGRYGADPYLEKMENWED
jgi:AAA15 family ATPase/GTPase